MVKTPTGRLVKKPTGRLVKGSDAAKEWAAKMKSARDLKRK
jgi:hypothetical protein